MLFRSIVFAEDGAVALEVFKKRRFDVVVTDLIMPNVNGLRLIHEIKRLDRDARIIAITGGSPGSLFVAESYGAVAVLTKPLDRDRLLASVVDALGKKKGKGQ